MYNAVMTYTTLFFDLDATLYPASSGLWFKIKDRIHKFMMDHLGLTEQEASSLREDYYLQYGTTLDGLMRHHHVDPEGYLKFVHDIPLEKFISYSPALKEILTSLPQALWVFTNSDREHAKRVLNILNLEHVFQGIVDVYALDFKAKPHPRAYRKALALAKIQSPSKCVLFDDLSQNLIPANELGFYTVIVNENNLDDHPADFHIHSLLDLPHKLPMLWKGED